MMAISSSGSVSQDLVSECLFVRACMCACVPCAGVHQRPGLTRGVGVGGWAQESLVIKNEAALGLWQVLLHKYRMKSKIIRGSQAIDDAIGHSE